ncbi:MAG: CARDB domain-containing protein, partial [Sulfuritalea sp.]|nr:CARDB domain-containing protein [Sulfuritalea sp.]
MIDIAGGTGYFGITGGKAWINQGTLTVGGDDHLYFGAYSEGNNTLTNAAGATLNLSSSNGYPVNIYSGTATINNAGTLNQTATGSHTIHNNISFNNTGTVNVTAGTLSYGSNLTNQGTINVTPGARFNVSGSFTNTATATLSVGLANASTMGVLAVGGTANLNGTLDVYMTGGYVPAASNTFSVITYASRTGAFSTLRWEPAYLQVTLDVDTTTSPWALRVRVVPGTALVVYDATNDFPQFNNGSGVWKTGWVPSLANYVFTQEANIWKNTSTSTSYGVAPGQISMHPYPSNPTALRFTAPTDGRYDVQAMFYPGDSGTIYAWMVLNGNGAAPIFGGTQSAPTGNTNSTPSFFTTIDLKAGDTLDTLVGNAYYYGNTPVAIRVSKSTLDLYPDLVVTDVVPMPAAGWLTGDSVTVNWKTRNQGAGTSLGSWNETLRVRNLTTGQTLITQDLPYDAVTLGDIGAGGLRDRSMTLTWPAGTDGTGQFEFTVTTDSSSHIFEYNTSGTGESNNASLINVLSAPDLVVSGLSSDAPAPKTGDLITLNWSDVNNGNTAVAAGWYDRIKVTNQSTGAVLLDQQVCYDPPQGGTMTAGASVPRSFSFRLAEGNAGVGNLLVQVSADQNTSGVGSLVEANASGTAETNNSASLNLTSTLATYPDLQVTDVTPTPALGWLGGDPVSVTWKTRNRGSGATSGSWTETLRVRNLSTGQTLFTQSLPYDATVLGDIAVNGLRDRSLDLTWPTGADASGQIEFTVTTDVVGQVFENNLAGTAEANNAGTTTVLSAVDLVVGNLTSDTPTPKTGDLITLTWNDINNGNLAVTAGWYDRIRVTNQATGAALVDQQLRYDPPEGGMLAAGASAARSYSFRLAEGNAGAGNLLIQVTTDQNTSGAGSLVEANAGGTGETNNGASLGLTSTLAPYPDVQVDTIEVSPSVGWQPADTVTVSWQIRNQGSGASTGSWTETLRVRNLTTGQIFFTQNLAYDASAQGDIAAGDLRDHSMTLTWPAMANAYGQFEFTVTTDVAGQLFENNLSNTAETNNANQITVLSAPDLVVSNLISDNPAPRTGDPITLNWNDANNGNAAVTAGWYDRIRVTNQSTGAVLVDQQLGYEPPLGETLAAGTAVPRSFSFRLAEGNAGVGNLLIQVTADQSTTGVGGLVEVNAAGDGETNNSASLNLTSTLATYPDLQVSDFAVSPNVGWQAADTVAVSWKTRNQGTGATSGSWTETLRVRNLTTGQTLFTENLTYDVSTQGDLAAGDLRDRSTTLIWPAGTNAYGQFEFTVTTDSAGQLFENNLAGTAETNNSSQLVVLSAPDLAVNSLTSDTLAPKTGDLITLNWNDINIGSAAVASGWYDRIKVTNQTTGVVLVDEQFRYDPPEGGTLPVATSVPRSYSFRLTDGNAGVGNLLIQVTADQSTAGIGGLVEANAAATGETNNGATLNLTSSLATYADLVPENLTLSPSVNFQPSQLVTATWNTVNRGNKATEQVWSERLDVVNLTTNVVVATVMVYEDPAAGSLGATEARARTAQFTWPVGVSASGRFSLNVRIDTGAAVLEANAAGTAENNNSIEIFNEVGPDMQIRTLRVDTADIQAGGLVSISWEDWNLGGNPANIGFNDRVVVRNLAGNQVLLDTSLAYDPLALTGGQPNGAIQPGESRSRSLTFGLPEGLAGTGNIEITVTADQNSAGLGVLYETNAGNNAEANNSAGIQATSVARPYADLRVDSLNGPATGVGGEPVTVAWTISNQGQADTAAAWNDQITFSNDSIIGNADDVVIGTVRHSGGLAVGASYSQTATFNVPMREMGHYYLGIRSDSGTEVLEPDTLADNVGAARGIDLATAYADLNVLDITAPTLAQSGEDILITWTVKNDGNATTNLASWNDKLVLSRDTTLSDDDIVLAGSVTHAGLLAPGQDYTARATMTLPRDLSGDYYVIVDTSANRSVFEDDRGGNNSRASIATLHVDLAAVADLRVAEVTGPATLRPGDTATVGYSLSNQGGAAASTSWRDRIYVDGGSGLIEVASLFNTDGLAVGATKACSVTFTLPTSLPDGSYHWVVKTDADDTLYERDGESNNQTLSAKSVSVARIDLAVSEVSGPALVLSGDSMHASWRVSNLGGVATSSWVDYVYLAKGTVLTKVAEVSHAGPLGTGEFYTSEADFTVPLDFSGEYQVVVVTDALTTLADGARGNNQSAQALQVDFSPYADLAVSGVTAPDRVIDDPAPLDVAWTVTNQGTGAGRTSSWTDRVILSTDDTYGNSDDRVLGEYQHDGALAVGASYSRAEQVLAPAGTTGRYKLFVVSDARGEVFENFSEGNNLGRIAQSVDIMPIAYADLQIASVTADGTASSGKSLRVTWEVANNGIGTTNIADWSDQVWLSRNPDGSDVVTQFGSARHVGQLAVGDRYSRSLDVTVPEGIEGSFYLNVRTGGPFEFIYGDNNTGTSLAIPITLSPSPDLVVETIAVPTTAQEGALIDVSWTVLNQGQAPAGGVWVDTVQLVPLSGGSVVTLGTFTYDRSLESGIRYSRTEQVRLPTKIEGLYRIKVITNANLGASGSQVYESGAARDNNTLLAPDLTEISLNDRPDLRVGTVAVPEHVTAGTSASIRYTISNLGPAAATGRWTDKVYLSLDGIQSSDDLLIGQYGNVSGLSPTESYANESALVDIPIRYRGDAYLIVVADGNSNVDEYPSEGNNVKAAHFYVDPVPFADLVTSDVVAPDQASYGSTIEVRYKVTNSGSDTTRGDSATLNSWTDTVWLARDRRYPGAYKGDILLGSFTHVGKLDVGADYLGTLQVRIPDNAQSGDYYISVLTDTYDVILEDSLTSNINPDDASHSDNSNYKSRPIGIIGAIPAPVLVPDLTVTEVSGLAEADSGGNYSFSYTVQNLGDAMSRSWTDTVYITDNPNLSAATEVWSIGTYSQQRTLGKNESYTVSQTVQLAPSVRGRYVVVKSDANTNLGESNEANNTGAAASVVTARPADLQVTEILTSPQNFSGEQTTVTWTVTNLGAAVWSGTRSWNDVVYLSRDPSFIRDRATVLGTVTHSNVQGLAAAGSYTASTKVTLPQGADGDYYIYVITDNADNPGDANQRRAKEEYLRGGDSDWLRNYIYGTTAYEGDRNDNNMARGSLDITYREPDLQIDSISVSNPNPSSGEGLTATWTVTNRGTRDTRVNSWNDGLYLSRDPSLDYGDYPLQISAVNLTQNGQPKYLKPGESYTWSASFNLPESISGDFHLIVKADTAIYRNPWNNEPSTIREGLAALARLGPETGTVNEFQGEGNNVASLALPITLATPPDLQVATVTAPDAVVAGQNFTVSYRVTNAGGDTPSDQTRWNDLVYLSKDRFLDVNQDRYVGYLQHGGGLAGGGSYDASLTVTAPKNLEGPYYVFVITDPARVWGDGESGKVREFGNEQNNATTAAQPILIETPPPADLKVSNVVLPASGTVGDNIQVSYTITNDSSNPAFGRWTDALYLSSDNAWDIGDVLLGKVDHNGDLGSNASYSGTLTASLPPLKDGNWRIIVRPDLYNEVFEGKISYTATGLNLPPGEANNRTASGSTLQVSVPVLEVATTLSTTLLPGQSRLYKVSVAAGETLRATLDSSVEEGSNELYIRYGDIPTGYAFDAAYTTPVATDQQALIPSTQAGDYYILVRARPGTTGVTTAVPITLRADLLPLSISKVTPDQGGTGDDEHRWVTVDIYGSRFKAGALVKLSRPGVYEAEPVRWQVLDATHIRAIFDERQMPHGLYDVIVTNPDGERVTEAARYLVERGIEADVALGIGGPRALTPGENALYSVSLQSLTNVDTPYVRFDIGTPEMGYADDVLEGIHLPYIVFGSNVGGQPNGVTLDAAGNTQQYGATPTDGTPRPEIPWAQLDGTENSAGFNLAPGYAVDLAAGGVAGLTFNVQTYPGLAEWIAHDFEGLRDKLYAVHPEWKAQGLLDGGIDDLDKLIAPETGLAAKFRAVDNDSMFPVHLTKLEQMAMPFEFNIAGAATALTRDEFVAEQTVHAKQLRAAILADADAPANLSTLATDETQWIDGWLGALEAAGLLRPVDEAPPIRDNPQVVSLNATLATGILLSHAGDTYRTQADILGFFAQVQTWYGDTASFAGDPSAIKVGIDHTEIRQGDTLNADVVTEVPVPEMADPAAFDRNATADTHFVNFKVFAGGKAEMEYLRHIGVLDGEFKPVAGQSLNLTQYLQQAAQQNAAASAVISVRGPQAAQGNDGDYVPTATALPYTLSFSNPSEQPAGQLRIVTEL